MFNLYCLDFYFQPTFNVVYWMTEIKFRRDFQIAVGTLSVLGVLFAGYRSWVWSKRAGKISIDFQTILNFLLYCAGSLANVFFIITFGIAFYLLIFFKVSCIFLFHDQTNDIFTIWDIYPVLLFQGLTDTQFYFSVRSIILFPGKYVNP